ncbi:MAG: DUF4830 domain-containing protein [Oscillospiraceae bacterium]|nr:DUF4830 domain-containing protein [Oscillospiraceae bacterium]
MKCNKKRIFSIIFAIVILFFAAFAVFLKFYNYNKESKKDFIKLENTDQIALFLLSNNLNLEEKEPVFQSKIYIPENFSETYELYAEMQENQQLPLKNYKGKAADEYIFLLNENNYAEIIISDNTLIGAITYEGSHPLNFEPIIY